MRSMAGRGASRARLPHPAVLGTTMIVLALAVLLVIGVHAAALGDDPSWAWDCNDTTCVDLWSGPREHYRQVAAGCGLAVLVGWAVVGLGLPSTPLPATALRAERTRWGPRAACAVVLIAPAYSAAGAILAVGSAPWGVAGAVGPVLIAGAFAWLGLRSRGCAQRIAWYLGMGEAILAILVAVAIMVLGFPFLLLAAVPVGLLAGGITACVLHVLLSQRSSRRAPTSAGPGADRCGRVPRPTVVDALCVLALVAVAVWAAWPVAAAPADAWMYGG